MNPLQWAQDNIFYTDAKTKEINKSAAKSARIKSIPSMMTPGQTYGDASYSQQQKTDAINKGVSDFFGIGKKPSTVVGPGGGNGFGLGSKNTVNTPVSEEVVSPTNNPPNNAAEINSRLAQQKKEREAALAVTKGNYDHSSGSYTGQGVAFVPDSIIDTNKNGGGGNRNSERTNPNGIVQKGTDMSRSFNDLLRTTNTSGYQPYSSNQLPTTAGSPDAAVSPKTQQILAGIQAGKKTDMSIEGYQEPTSSAKAGVLSGIRGGARTDRGIQGTSTAADGVLAGIQGGQKTDQGIEGYKKPGSTSRLDAALNDKAGINSYMSKFSSGDQERAANRAFLDADTSMEGLRAKEAVNGVVFAQNQHYVAGADADGPAQKITRDNARDISSGNAKAQDFLQKKTADAVAAVKQSPTLLEQGAKDGAFQQDKPMFSGSTPAIGGAVEFDNNNDQTLPTFGAPKGYKPQGKRIDTSMGNPFG